MKIKVGDKVKMTKEAQKLFPKGTLYTVGVVKEVFPNLGEIRVKRFSPSFEWPYRGHEYNVWLRDCWRLSR